MKGLTDIQADVGGRGGEGDEWMIHNSNHQYAADECFQANGAQNLIFLESTGPAARQNLPLCIPQMYFEYLSQI